MRFLSFFKLLPVVLIVLAFVGCEEDEGSGVDFKSYKNDAAFFIDNSTNHRLVAFKGNLSANNLLGGIPANADYHGIKKNLSLFTKTEGFTVIFITEEQYIANKNNLGVLVQTPFSREYVYYNHGMDNPQRYEISGQVGGRHTLNLINGSGLDVSLRFNGPGGPTLGYATRQMHQTKFPMYGGDFYIYPVFMFYNHARDVLVKSYPTRSVDGGSYFRAVNFPIVGPDTERNFDVADAYNSIENNMTLGVAWVVFDNQSVTDSITVEEGTTPLSDTFGQALFAPGDTKTLPINMPGVSANSFASQRTVQNLFVRVADIYAQVSDKNGNTSFTLITDHQYLVNVTGSVNAGFVARINIDAGDVECTVCNKKGGTHVDIRSLYND